MVHTTAIGAADKSHRSNSDTTSPNDTTAEAPYIPLHVASLSHPPAIPIKPKPTHLQHYSATSPNYNATTSITPAHKPTPPLNLPKTPSSRIPDPSKQWSNRKPHRNPSFDQPAAAIQKRRAARARPVSSAPARLPAFPLQWSWRRSVRGSRVLGKGTVVEPM